MMNMPTINCSRLTSRRRWNSLYSILQVQGFQGTAFVCQQDWQLRFPDAELGAHNDSVIAQLLHHVDLANGGVGWKNGLQRISDQYLQSLAAQAL